MHLGFQLIHLLLAKASLQTVSVEKCLSESHSKGKETRRKDRRIPSNTRTRLKITGNNSYGVMTSYLKFLVQIVFVNIGQERGTESV